jgi:uncharacterized protein (DUF983 family)
MKNKKKTIKKKEENVFGFEVDVAKGTCPYCKEHTVLISIVKNYYRCGTCGEDTEQYINGSIKYLPLDIKAGDLKFNGEKK